MKKTIIFSILLLVLVVAGCSQTPEVTGPIDGSLKEIQTRGKLVVGTNVPFEPMEFYDESGEIVGYDVDVAQEIADDMGVELEIVNYEWDSLFDATKAGEVDLMISSVTITVERSETMLFSIPYFNGGQAIVVKKEAEEADNLAGLEGRTVGVQEGVTSEDVVKEGVAAEDIVIYGDTLEKPYMPTAIAELKAGTIDAFVTDYIAAVGVVGSNPGLKISGEPFNPEFYGIATKLDNEALISEVDKVIRAMKNDGRFDEIAERWI